MWNKQIQSGNLISNFRKIFDSSYDEQERGACDSLVNLCRIKKKNKEDDHLFQNVCANWIIAYFHFPQVC